MEHTPYSDPPILLELHNPAWATEFARLRKVYLHALGPLILRVEHVGSTAVPGLLAKPIVDIDIVMPRYYVLTEIVARLRDLGYRHAVDQGISGRESFKRHDEQSPYTSPQKRGKHITFTSAQRMGRSFVGIYSSAMHSVIARSCARNTSG